MKKIVGILLRKDENYHMNSSLADVLINFGVIPLGIIGENINDLINISKICSGFVLQGGSDYNDVEISFVKYIYEHNIPTLGICLGMQMMGVMKNGELMTLGSKHYSSDEYVHNVLINKNSMLYKIIGKDEITVNSRHHDILTKTDLHITGISSDNVIESIEDASKKFFIGVQWHPESIMDSNSNSLFSAFINSL